MILPHLWRRNSRSITQFGIRELMFISKLRYVLNFLRRGWNIEWKLAFCLVSRDFLLVKILVHVRTRSMLYMFLSSEDASSNLGFLSWCKFRTYVVWLILLGDLEVLNGNLLFVWFVRISCLQRDLSKLDRQVYICWTWSFLICKEETWRSCPTYIYLSV